MDQRIIKVKDLTTQEVYKWTIKDVLEEINRDRSDKWTDYDESDWEEGWDAWCEGDIYTMIQK